MTESFFGTRKEKSVDLLCFCMRAEARQTIFELVGDSYNPVRRHSSLGYKSPVVYEHAMDESEDMDLSR